MKGIMGLPRKDLFQFGSFRVDPAERLLTHAGRPVSLTPKAFETLVVLVENAGHALDKDELLKKLWPDTFVEEATLAKQISTVRKALGDGENGSRYIETIPKFGYRFVADVRRIEADPQAATPAIPTKDEFPTTPLAGRARTGHAAQSLMKWRAAAAAVVLIALATSMYFLWTQPRSTAALPAKRVVLAVLPFENLSGDPEQEYIADGLTEEMIARLSRLNPESLAVIARTSAMKFKGAKRSIAEISRELGVDYVLESSFRREGDRVRITAQLVQSSDQTHLWAENYEREVGQILPLQRELAQTIARQVRVVLVPQAGSLGLGQDTADSQAHLLYLKGRYYWNIRQPDSLTRAVQHYRQALDRDPNYAPAWAGMATAFALFDEYNVMPAREAYPRAKAAAARALELDPAQVDARAALALIRAQYDWDRAGAEQDFKQAVAINPNSSVARHWYGISLMAWGRSDEARQQFELALQNDPLSNSLPVAIGASYYHARQFEQAIKQYVRAVKARPDSAGLRFHLGRAYVQQNMLAEAVTEFETGARLTGGNDGDASLAFGYAAAGRRDDALRVLKEINRADDLYSPYYLAAVHTALGNADQAMQHLERAFDQRVGRLTFLNVEPMFDPLRNDPRFRDLCQRIGLPEVAQAFN
ncbi:MAG: tetratricopeptide repeat protein [Candidatus Acidiferrales bacterium]